MKNGTGGTLYKSSLTRAHKNVIRNLFQGVPFWDWMDREPPPTVHFWGHMETGDYRPLSLPQPRNRLISDKTPRFNTLIPKGLRAVVPTMCPSHYGGFEHG